jgi:fumarate hydratase class I
VLIDAIKNENPTHLAMVFILDLFVGGPAAILAKENITYVEVVDFEEMGMEAVRKITIKDFPAFIITDDKGNDFFENL